ncbi:MAG: DUF2817 domain-containing protein [Planctomycetaceae bacterium]|nr:MAG: DUF2817 domain-containing protein [Planctomycetaceae bacterium]
MKVAQLRYLVLPLLLAGCANPRSFSGGGMGGPTPTYSPTPLDGSSSPGGSTLGDPSEDFSRRTNRPINPRVTSPAGRTAPRPAPTPAPTKPAPAPKGPTLGLPTAKSGSQPQGTTASMTSPLLGDDDPETGLSVRNAVQVPLVWNRRYQSTERRAIETLVFGAGPRRLMIISSLHGDEPQSMALVDELAAFARANPNDLGGQRVLFVRTPNPDGLAGRSSVNSHGVDLNRNFPGQNWVRTPDRVSGARPASELETQVLVRLMTEFKPQLLVHLKDSRDQGRVNAEGSCRELGAALCRRTKFESLQDGGAKTTGSVENFAWTKLNCPALTVLVPLEKDDATAWEKNQTGLLSILRGDTAAVSARPTEDVAEAERLEQRPASRQTAAAPSSLKSQQRSSETSKAPSRRAAARRNESDATVPERGYYELPQP